MSEDRVVRAVLSLFTQDRSPEHVCCRARLQKLVVLSIEVSGAHCLQRMVNVSGRHAVLLRSAIHHYRRRLNDARPPEWIDGVQ